MNNFEIITRALRRLGVIASGQTATTDEMDDALEALRSLFSRMVSDGTFGRLSTIEAGAGVYDATPMTRVIRSSPDTTKINLPTIAPDKSVIIIADIIQDTTSTFVYDVDAASWTRIETMTQTSRAPFGSRDALGLSAYLAAEMSSEFGVELSEILSFDAARYHASLGSDLSREINPTISDYF